LSYVSSSEKEGDGFMANEKLQSKINDLLIEKGYFTEVAQMEKNIVAENEIDRLIQLELIEKLNVSNKLLAAIAGATQDVQTDTKKGIGADIKSIKGMLAFFTILMVVGIVVFILQSI
jgi:hypothetical protein